MSRADCCVQNWGFRTRHKFASQHSTSVVAGKQIEFNGVEVVTPTGHSLIKDLTFAITPGTNMLIVGPNGAGKSSIFRCIPAWTLGRLLALICFL